MSDNRYSEYERAPFPQFFDEYGKPKKQEPPNPFGDTLSDEEIFYQEALWAVRRHGDRMRGYAPRTAPQHIEHEVVGEFLLQNMPYVWPALYKYKRQFANATWPEMLRVALMMLEDISKTRHGEERHRFIFDLSRYEKKANKDSSG